MTERQPAAQPVRPTERLFIALWPAAEVRDALAACRDRFEWPPSARPVATDKLHLTLHFLGHLAADRVAALADALQIPSAGFEFCLDRIDCWAGGLTVLRPQRLPPPLQLLHAALAECLRQLDLPVEARRFRPHVTLARRHGGCEPTMLDRPIHWPVDGHALVQSTADGLYRVVRRYPANAAGGAGNTAPFPGA